MESKKLYAIYHGYHLDGGFGDSVYAEEMTGLVWATKSEIDAFVDKYDNPITYSKPYDYLDCHMLRAEEVTVADSLDQIKPYGEDDSFGKAAREYEVKQEFEEKYGHNWLWNDPDGELHKLYQEALRKLHQEEGEA